MPSLHHEALLLLFRNRPLLAPELLRDALHQSLPKFSEARVESAELTDIQPAEYRADLVVLLLEDRPVLGIVIEAQLANDDAKHYAWPAYVANLRARIKCPVCLLVVVADQQVARWAARPIMLGGGQCFTPCVLGPNAVPQITDAAQAQTDPELAVFSAMAHGQSADSETAMQIASSAISACAGLDADRAALYVDLILNSVPEVVRRALLAMKTANYEFQSEFARRYHSTGRVEGRADTLIELAAQKFGPLGAEVESRIRSATAAELEGMTKRLLNAATLDEMCSSS
jgi:hypothetical protein